LPDRAGTRRRLLEGLGSDERAQVQDVATLLAAAAPASARPPGSLEERTLAVIRSDRRVRNGSRGIQHGADSHEEAPDGRARSGRPPARTKQAGGPAPGGAPVAPTRPRARLLRHGRLALAGGLALALALGALAGTLLDRDAGPSGTLELEATLRAPAGVAAATATVRETGIGRLIEFRTDELPILPTGEYYELWFVGPGDRPEQPNRISAGTFHPDPEGRSQVSFTAAVDPAKYPDLAVTAEPGDGDPSPSGPDVLRTPRGQTP
jgi:Anti-sigma-K factor rskA